MSETSTKESEKMTLDEIAAPFPGSFVDGPFGSNLKTTEYTSEGVRLIQLQNIGEGYWLNENQKFISSQKFKQLIRHAAYPGDIAIAKMADPVARACLIPPVSDKFVVVADCIKLGPDKSRHDLKYLVYAINHHNVRYQAECKSTGTTRKRINLSVLKTIEVWTPKLKEQQKIAEILDTVDRAIALTQTHITKLKKAKAGLLHDLLTRGIDEHGELRDPTRKPEQFKDSPLGKIPKDWDNSTLGSYLSFITDYRGMTPPYTQEGIPVISAENVGNGRIKSITKYVTPEIYKIWMTRGFPEVDDVIFTTEAPVGEVALFPSSGIYMLTRRVIALRSNVSALRKRFLYWYLFCLNSMNKWKPYYHGSTVPRILKPDILKQKVPLPTSDEQDKIIRILDSHEQHINSKTLALEKLKLLKKGLMSDLLTGKVRVKI